MVSSLLSPLGSELRLDVGSAIWMCALPELLSSSLDNETLASLSTVRGEIALSVVMLVALEIREVWLLRVELDKDLWTSASELSVGEVDGLLELDLRRCSSCSRM